MTNNLPKITIQLSAGLLPLIGESSPPRHQLPALLGCPLTPPVATPTVVSVREEVPSPALTPGKAEWAGSVGG